EIDRNKRNTLDLLSFQVQEIEDAQLSAEEEQQLNNDKQLIKNAEHILSSLSDAYNYLFGDDDILGGLSALQEAAMSTEKVSSFAEALSEISAKLNDAAAIAQDAGFELKSFMDDFDIDISDIDTIEERLDVYYRMKRKYGPEVEDVLAFYEESKAELEKIEFAREKLEKLYSERNVITDKLSISAGRLTQNRKDVFDKLASEIEQSLVFLNMPDVKLYLSCENKNYGPDGQDNIEFLISTNRGENAKPMAKIASGGELSRIMLAIKSVLAEKEDTHTLIFDEIDTGVSGSTAMKIGKLLKQTSSGKQVLCVTHSAQIAAFADNHLFIQKNTRGDATFTSVTLLGENEREREIARIISGDNVSDTALMNAKEMISAAKNS
ncbi:MAG: DNA repair protein RecN, partial [Oscillospiraceae bacterium]|nr:DNA repair protein RecN [Oscillospiraceae bacterium]